MARYQKNGCEAVRTKPRRLFFPLVATNNPESKRGPARRSRTAGVLCAMVLAALRPPAMHDPRSHSTIQFVATQALVVAASFAVGFLLHRIHFEAAVISALGLPVLVGLGAVVLRCVWPAPHEGIRVHLLRFLLGMLVSIFGWAALFAAGYVLVDALTTGASYLPDFFLSGVFAVSGPLIVCSGGLLVLFRLGFGQRSPF